MTSRGHNLVLCTDKRPQKIIIRYSTQTNDLTKVITHYPMQKYDLKMSQSRIPHRQTTSKDHNPVFHTDKRPHKGHNLIIQKDKKPHRSSPLLIVGKVICLPLLCLIDARRERVRPLYGTCLIRKWDHPRHQNKTI